MPAPDPGQGWFGVEWNRFSQGFQNLNPGSVENIIDGYQATQLPPGYQNYISMPWESPLWVYPGNMTEAERQEMRYRMLGAPDREMAASWGQMMNALDNVQDIIVSIGLLGSLAFLLAGGLLGPLAPLIGGILFLADLLAALTLLGQLLSVLYALICQGIGKGLAAAVPAALFSRGAKGKMGKVLFNNPVFHKGWFTQRPPRFGWGGAAGLLLQLPQATATLFGYGIALGGIVGTITQGAAGLEKVATGQPINSFTSHPAHRRFGGINRRLRDDNPADLYLLHRAAATMATAPLILRYPDAVPPLRYFAALTALDAASHVVYRRLHGYPWQAWMQESFDVPLEQPAYFPKRARAHVATFGIHESDPLPWAYPGNPQAVAPSAYVQHAAPLIAAGVDRWLAQNRMADFAAGAGQMVNRITRLAWGQLLDGEEAVKWETTIDAQLLEVHASTSRVPAQVGDLQRIWSYWQELRLEAERRPTAKWTGEYLDAVAARHQVRLIRFLPPDAPWPQEWADWLAANRHAPRP